jgi:hypothetical protein
MEPVETRDEELKASLPPGEWQNEPDRIEWRVGDFACLMVRGFNAAWCGYVGVSPGHPWHGQHYDDVPVDVHGQLTYGKECAGRICHVPRDGEPEHLWWLGFDCAHGYDATPRGGCHMLTTFLECGYGMGTYRNVAYVRAEVEKLAAQARDAVLLDTTGEEIANAQL